MYSLCCQVKQTKCHTIIMLPNFLHPLQGCIYSWLYSMTMWVLRRKEPKKQNDT